MSLSKADMVRHLLREMQKQKTVSRSVNTYSVDKASRRETALITAARWDTAGAVLQLYPGPASSTACAI